MMSVAMLFSVVPVALLAALPTLGSPITITNSGSTNTTGYSIQVSSTGQVSYRILGSMQAAPTHSAHVSPSLAKRLYQDAHAAQPLSALPVTHMIKSVSFGTSTYVMYKGQRTPDLSAPATAPGKALAADVTAVVAALHLKNEPRR